MNASVITLDNNKVKITVEVDSAAVDAAVDATAKAFAQDINIKGFRKGKAPRQMIEARIGGPRVLRAEALNASIPDFYARAVADTMIDPIAQPSIHITSGEESGDLTFEAEVEVRPELEISGYTGLKVTIPSPVPTDDEIEVQVKKLRETDAELVTVDRGVATGDYVVLAIEATDPADETNRISLSDYTYHVGSDTLTDGLDELILGLKSGETLELIGRGPGGVTMTWNFSLGEVQEQVLPELTDEWVEENTDYATIEALREGLTAQMSRMKVVEAQMSRRDATLNTLGDLIDESLLPEALIESETDYRVHDLEHRLSSQGLDLGMFLRVTNQTPESIVETLKADAKKGVRVDLALRALARAENLEPTEDEIAQELAETAESMGVDAAVLEENLRDSGRVIAFRAEVAKLKASRWLYDNVTYVDPNGAELDPSIFEANQASAFEA